MASTILFASKKRSGVKLSYVAKKFRNDIRVIERMVRNKVPQVLADLHITFIDDCHE